MADNEHDEEEKLHNSSDTTDADDDQPEEQTDESTRAVNLGALAPLDYGTDEYYDELNLRVRVLPDADQPRSYPIEAERRRQDLLAEAPLLLSFTFSELDEYATHRSEGLADKSQDWIIRASQALWESTKGEISHQSVTALRTFALEKYQSADSHSKVLSFARSFLKFLATTKAEPRYQTFAPYLELPKTVKERKSVTSRIVTKEDINNGLQHVAKAERGGKISPERAAQYSALVLFGAYAGQRSEATMAKLTVGQFREAMAADKPVLLVESSQDKVRMSHYVPLHSRVVEALKPLLVGRDDDELMFTHSSFLQWTKRQKIPMSHFKGHFVLGDLRKFAEQYGDIIQWDESNRAYILTHGVSGIAWSHYNHPLPEQVYSVYMKFWQDIKIKTD